MMFDNCIPNQNNWDKVPGKPIVAKPKARTYLPSYLIDIVGDGRLWYSASPKPFTTTQVNTVKITMQFGAHRILYSSAWPE